MNKLKQIHKRIKNHPFRLGERKNWKSYYKLLRELDTEFTAILEEKFKEEQYNGWGFFIHELRGTIWHFQFEFNEGEFEGEHGRAYLKNCGKDYGKIVPKYQNKIVVILENYIQQIHKFIITGEFNEFITYYFGGDKCMKDIQSNGKSRWNKHKLNRTKGEFEWVGKLK